MKTTYTFLLYHNSYNVICLSRAVSAPNLIHNCVWCASIISVNNKRTKLWVNYRKYLLLLHETQYHSNLTPWLIESKMYSDVTSKVRSKKNAPSIIVAAKVDVLLKRVLYNFPPIPAILSQPRAGTGNKYGIQIHTLLSWIFPSISFTLN